MQPLGTAGSTTAASAAEPVPSAEPVEQRGGSDVRANAHCRLTGILHRARNFSAQFSTRPLRLGRLPAPTPFNAELWAKRRVVPPTQEGSRFRAAFWPQQRLPAH